METTTRLILPEVIEALKNNPKELSELTEELHPADLADLVSVLEPELARELIRLLPVESSARLLEQLAEEERSELFQDLIGEALPRAVAITHEMAPDDRADLLGELDEEAQAQLLSAVSPDDTRDIQKLLSYPESSAGALMTTDFVVILAEMTASQAIDHVRRSATEVETIYQAYAVDKNRTLLGVVSLRDLVTSPATRKIEEVMNPKIVTALVDQDQEEVARLMAKYDLLAIPVVDGNHRIVGIITVDDVMDVVEKEATEDVQKMGAVEPLEAPYIATPMVDLLKARAPWLVVLFIAGLFTRNVLEFYRGSEFNKETLLLLGMFVPLVISAGGNSGSQSASLIIRGLALGTLRGEHTLAILLRELAVGVALGLILSIVGVLSAGAWESSRHLPMFLTIGLAVPAVVALGSILGSGIPLLLNRMRIDPAVASTPFIASMCDVTGLIIYYEIARLFLL